MRVSSRTSRVRRATALVGLLCLLLLSACSTGAVSMSPTATVAPTPTPTADQRLTAEANAYLDTMSLDEKEALWARAKKAQADSIA